jgi:transposase
LAGPRKAGYPTELWTCQRVAEVIAKKFHVEYHPDHVGKILHRLLVRVHSGESILPAFQGMC